MATCFSVAILARWSKRLAGSASQKAKAVLALVLRLGLKSGNLQCPCPTRPATAAAGPRLTPPCPVGAEHSMVTIEGRAVRLATLEVALGSAFGSNCGGAPTLSRGFACLCLMCGLQ